MKRDIPDITIQGARILFRNFSGKPGDFNLEGKKEFVCLLDPQLADAMVQDGWNVKYLKAREEGDVPQPYVNVAVSYRNKPPRIVLVSKKSRTTLPEDMVHMLDYADVDNIDLKLNPFQWGPNARGESGVKAYLKSMYVRIVEDELEKKYAGLEEIEFGSPQMQIGGAPQMQIAGAPQLQIGNEQIIDAEIISDTQG